MTTAWTAEHVRMIDASRIPHVSRIPLIDSFDRSGLEAGRIYWDMWPIQDRDGFIAKLAGRELWMALSAPDRGDPALRHFEAKIRLLERAGGRWVDLGDALPQFATDYEREWAGSAVTDGQAITLYFTAAGTNKRPGGYQQRLVEAHGEIGADGLPHSWDVPKLSIMPSIDVRSAHYMPADAHEGEAGKIKAFRDPAYFRDPADGQEYLIFTASLAAANSAHNGAVGIARKCGDKWELLPPLIHADGINNELERAHALYHNGRYYIFWATQNSTFSPQFRNAPNGLYGMVSDRLMGEYQPLNGSGLVLANPHHQPLQSYSWFVSAELLVSSFVDYHGLCDAAGDMNGWNNADDGGEVARSPQQFGGLPAPLLRLEIDGDICRFAGLEAI